MLGYHTINLKTFVLSGHISSSFGKFLKSNKVVIASQFLRQQKLVKNALDHKLTDVESDLAACPSPNCTGVYRKVRSGQEGQTSFCNFCGVNICRRSVGRGSEAEI